MVSESQYQEAVILIVDDQSTVIILLESMLKSAGYKNIHSTTKSSTVLDLYRNLRPDLMLLDIQMPDVDGFQVMGQLEVANRKNEYLPILVLSAEQDQETRHRALDSGAKDFLNKPFDRIEVLMRIRNILEASLLYKEIRHQNEDLEKRVQERTNELRETQREIVQRLGRAAEFRDTDTGAHISRMSRYSEKLGRAAGLGEEECELILLAMSMHDVGKIGIPDHILLKPGKLTADEWDVMRTHTILGAQLLSGSQSPLLQMGETVALTHHEKWNGTGYPHKLAGHDIPLPGRICAVCDVFDALTSARPYKDAWPIDKALEELRNLSGSHLDPYLVDLFYEILPAILKIQELYPEPSIQSSQLVASI